MNRLTSVFCCAITSLFCAGLATADTVWTYTGNTISYALGVQPGPTGVNPCGCALDGTLTLDSNNLVTSYSFTAGKDTLTQANSTGLLGTDPFALINVTDSYFRWAIGLTGLDGTVIHSTFDGSLSDAMDYSSGGLFVYADPGIWVDPPGIAPVGTPEPGTITLLGIALASLASVARRK